MSSPEQFTQVDSTTEKIYSITLSKLHELINDFSTQVNNLTRLSTPEQITTLIQEYFKLKNTFEYIKASPNALFRLFEKIVDNLLPDRQETFLKNQIEKQLKNAYETLNNYAAANGIRIIDITDSTLTQLYVHKNDKNLVPKKESRKLF